MNDGLGAFFAAVLEEDGKTKDFWLDNLWHGAAHFLVALAALEELAGKNLEDHISGNSLGQQLVKLSTNRSQLFWALLRYDVLCNLLGIRLILGAWNVTLCIEIWILKLHSLQHHDGSS